MGCMVRRMEYYAEANGAGPAPPAQDCEENPRPGDDAKRLPGKIAFFQCRA